MNDIINIMENTPNTTSKTYNLDFKVMPIGGHILLESIMAQEEIRAMNTLKAKGWEAHDLNALQSGVVEVGMKLDIARVKWYGYILYNGIYMMQETMRLGAERIYPDFKGMMENIVTIKELPGKGVQKYEVSITDGPTWEMRVVDHYKVVSKLVK